MSDAVPDRIEPIRRQMLAYLRTLQGAGVDWLPLPDPAKASPIAMAQPPEKARAEPAATLLFEAARPVEVQAIAPLDERRLALGLVADEVKGCTRCAELCSTRTQTVFGQGPLGAEVCLVGEAPGAEEDAAGIPFVGPAGRKLNEILAASGLKREEIYICNTIKCRPPGNRTPAPNEMANCRGYLERQIALVAPQYIIALGGSAAVDLLNTTQSLGKLRGRFHDFNGIPVMVTYHPSYILPHRNPEKKREVWEDMKWFMKQLGRPILPRTS